jgi:hypothetical protein
MILDNPKSYVAKTAETPDGCLGVGAHADASEYIMPLAPSCMRLCVAGHMIITRSEEAGIKDEHWNTGRGKRHSDL